MTTARILGMVRQAVNRCGIAASNAYPGRIHPAPLYPEAACRILRVDQEAHTVTVEVFVVCAASLGGDSCESWAMKALEELKRIGASCVMEGCTFSGVGRTYTACIRAEFREEELDDWKKVRVSLGETPLEHMVRVSAEKITTNRIHYAMGQSAPVGITAGELRYSITLEELIPPGEPEPEPEDTSVLDIITITRTERYSGCCWEQVTREFTRKGLGIIRKGYALAKEVAENGQPAV